MAYSYEGLFKNQRGARPYDLKMADALRGGLTPSTSALRGTPLPMGGSGGGLGLPSPDALSSPVPGMPSQPMPPAMPGQPPVSPAAPSPQPGILPVDPRKQLLARMLMQQTGAGQNGQQGPMGNVNDILQSYLVGKMVK